MAKNIGATLSLKDNNFFTTIKNATNSLNGFQKHTTNATGSLKKMGSQSKLSGDSLASLAKKALGVVAAYASFRQVTLNQEFNKIHTEQRLQSIYFGNKESIRSSKSKSLYSRI